MNYIDKSTQITEGLRKSFQTTNCKITNRICYGYITASDGEEVQVLIKGHPKAIVTMSDFEKVQQMKFDHSKATVQNCSMKMSF